MIEFILLAAMRGENDRKKIYVWHKKKHLKPIRLISESSGFFSDEELIMADDVAKEA